MSWRALNVNKAFGLFVEASGPNHVGMDETGLAEGHSSQHSAWGLFHARPCISHRVTHSSLKEMQSLLH